MNIVEIAFMIDHLESKEMSPENILGTIKDIATKTEKIRFKPEDMNVVEVSFMIDCLVNEGMAAEDIFGMIRDIATRTEQLMLKAHELTGAENWDDYNAHGLRLDGFRIDVCLDDDEYDDEYEYEFDDEDEGDDEENDDDEGLMNVVQVGRMIKYLEAAGMPAENIIRVIRDITTDSEQLMPEPKNTEVSLTSKSDVDGETKLNVNGKDYGRLLKVLKSNGMTVMAIWFIAFGREEFLPGPNKEL